MEPSFTPHPAAATAILDEDRLEALTSTDLLDSAPEDVFDQLTLLAARVNGAPVSLMALLDRDRSYFKSEHGIPQVPPGRTVPLSHSLCQHVVALDAPFVVDDARTHPLTRDNGGVTDLGVGAYLGVPIRSPSGHVLGTMCTIDLEARTWTDADVASLTAAAAAAQGEIALRAENRARESAELAQAEAERMSRLQSSFLANMSHEIRTPLTSILGNAEFLRDEAPLDLRDVAGSIASGGQRLMDTLTSLLDLSQLEAGLFGNEPVLIAVSDRVLEVASQCAAKAEAKGIALQAALDPDLPPVSADAALFDRIVGHLVENAVKFTHEGSVTVRSALEDGAVRIEVEDTGVGIPLEAIPYLFVPFQQASDGHGRAFEGNGLGLALAQRLATLIGGRIEVESEVGKGSTFALVLPAATV